MRYGQLILDPILKSDQAKIDLFDCNPYWAVGADSIGELLVMSALIAPNHLETCWLFNTDKMNKALKNVK